MLKIIDITNTTATTLDANTDCTRGGKISQIPTSLAVVNPIPTDRERDAITILRCSKPHAAIIWIPDVKMDPNIIMVHPPKTASGRDAKKFPTGGRRPARIMLTAPVMMVKRLTTFVIATRPTFWEKEVTGGHPNNAENADA